MVFDVYTDLPPTAITQIAVAVLEKWIAFAMGKDSIGGHVVKSPTGRYASSIRMERFSPTHVAVIADTDVAPEALILETGHESIDLKQVASLKGRTIPMHRGAGKPIYNSTAGSRGSSIWAVPRAAGFNGFARVPSEITPENIDSWVIPAMPAWSPAAYLADLASRAAVLAF